MNTTCQSTVLSFALAALFGCHRRGSEHDFRPAPPPAEMQAIAGFDGTLVTNTLGMKLVYVPGTAVAMCIWETRVRDFAAFVDATGYDATTNMISVGKTGWAARGDSWKSPGFEQTDDHPVVGVSLLDAGKFCEWLTARERHEGRLSDTQMYRLPTDREWSFAVGLPDGRYSGDDSSSFLVATKDLVHPWGRKWPPPPGAGNLYGSETIGTFRYVGGIAGYSDAYPFTAPVGMFKPNALGIYDLAGNVWEWCNLRSSHSAPGCSVLRGNSWFAGHSCVQGDSLSFSYCNMAPRRCPPDRMEALSTANSVLPAWARYANSGFRVVLGFGEMCQ